MPSPPSSKRFLGLINRRERWGLSWRGWLALLVIATAGAGLTLVRIYPFLAVTERFETPVLVVEGWINDHYVKQAAEEFRGFGYDRIYTTGGPVPGMGGYVNDYSTGANIAATRLVNAEVPRDRIRRAPSRVRARDRTYGAAVALKDAFARRGETATRINVVTANVHARRTRYLFQRAFGDSVEIGIIALPSPDYDAKRWWRYSEAVREIIGECIAYTYARFFFYPNSDGNGAPEAPGVDSSNSPDHPS